MSSFVKVIASIGVCLTFSQCEIPTSGVAPNRTQSTRSGARTAAVDLPDGLDNFNLCYQDLFDQSRLNETDWLYRTDTRFGGQNLKSQVVVTNNVLTINYDRNQDAAGNIQHKSGGIISKQTFGYGFYEVKAKLYRATKGLHQSFWTMGLNPKEPSASSPTADPDQYQLVANDLLPAFNQALEIDGFEQNSKDGFLASNHHVYTPSQTSSINQLTRPNPGTDWFRMGFLWAPTYIKFFYRSEMNGQWVAVATKSLTTDGGKWDVYAPQNFWLTALATPEYPTWWDGETRLPASDAAMQVEYLSITLRINRA